MQIGANSDDSRANGDSKACDITWHMGSERSRCKLMPGNERRVMSHASRVTASEAQQPKAAQITEQIAISTQ